MAPRPYSRYTRNGSDEAGPPNYIDPTADVIQMRERVRALDDGVASLASNVAIKFSEISAILSGLSTKIEERGRAPWNLMIGFASFLTVFAASVGGLAYWPIREQLTELKTIETKLADDKIGSREFYNYVTQGKERRDQEGKTFSDRLDRTNIDIKDLREQVVPRTEHTEQWMAQRTKDGDIQRQIDELRSNVSSIYSPKDALDRLVRRLDDLEDRAHTRQGP